MCFQGGPEDRGGRAWAGKWLLGISCCVLLPIPSRQERQHGKVILRVCADAPAGEDAAAATAAAGGAAEGGAAVFAEEVPAAGGTVAGEEAAVEA